MADTESNQKELPIYEIDLARDQLSRMRGMTRYYHQRFFSDTRFTVVALVSLLLFGFWGVTEAFLIIPVVALIGANQTAFDASYLHFARHYAAELEHEINSAMRRRMLVGAELEDRYLYPLNKSKVVTIGFGQDFSWFGWMTVLYTSLGALAFGLGLALGWQTLYASGTGWVLFYLVALTLATVGSLTTGGWWFVSGVGEARLQGVLESRFGHPVAREDVTRIAQ